MFGTVCDSAKPEEKSSHADLVVGLIVMDTFSSSANTPAEVKFKTS